MRATRRPGGAPRSPRIVALPCIVALLSGLAPAAAAASSSEGAPVVGEAGGRDGGHHEAEPKLNWFDISDRHTVAIVGIVANFAILVTLLVVFGRKPIRRMLADRSRKVEEEIDGALEEKLRAEGRLQGVLARTKNLDEELMLLREDLLRVGHDERDRLVADAGARAEKIRRESEFAAVEEERRAVRELRAKVVERAVDGARRALREKLSAADQARLADGFLGGLSAREGGAG